MIDLNKDVKYIKGVGPARAELLNKVGIFTLGDAISYFPRGHEDRGNIKNIAELVDGENKHDNPGEILSCDAAKNRIEVACSVGSIAVTHLLPEGKSRMSAADYINGRKIAVGDVLTKYSK